MNYDGHEEDAWMARVAEGDESALQFLVERWERPVLAFLTRCLGEREEARDLSQETFLRVYRNAHRYRAQGNFRSWLFRIAGNLCRSQQRRQRLLRWLPLMDSPGAKEAIAPSSFDADASTRSHEFARALDEILNELPLRQRMAFLLRRQEELSYREIAVAMDTTPSAVESLLVRATSFVQRAMKNRHLDQAE